MNTYIVTGGAGFIGSNFIHYMLSKHDDICIVNIDALTYAGNIGNLASVKDDPRHTFVHANICDKDSIANIFEKWRPEYVVNFAAESHVDRSIKNPSIFAKTNVEGTICLLDAFRSIWEREDGSYPNGVKFLQIGTDEVYGSLPLEDPTVFFHETTPLNPHSPYSASKASADFFVKAYGDTYGTPVNITRYSNNYGPYQFPEKLIPLMIDHSLRQKSLPVYGDGLNVRDWLYVEDHCKAIDMVLSSGRPGEIYNVGGHNERSNIDIVQTIIDTVARKTGNSMISDELIEYVVDRKGHDRRYGISPDKIKEELGWYPETSFEVGIARTIDWYLENKAWVDGVANGTYRQCSVELFENKSDVSR